MGRSPTASGHVDRRFGRQCRQPQRFFNRAKRRPPSCGVCTHLTLDGPRLWRAAESGPVSKPPVQGRFRHRWRVDLPRGGVGSGRRTLVTCAQHLAHGPAVCLAAFACLLSRSDCIGFRFDLRCHQRVAALETPRLAGRFQSASLRGHSPHPRVAQPPGHANSCAQGAVGDLGKHLDPETLCHGHGAHPPGRSRRRRVR